MNNDWGVVRAVRHVTSNRLYIEGPEYQVIMSVLLAMNAAVRWAREGGGP